MLFLSEKENKLSLGEEFRRVIGRFPSLNLEFNINQNHCFGLVIPKNPQVSYETRQFHRFSLTLQARRHVLDDRISPILIKQISLGGCLVEWDETVLIGKRIRVEVLLSNGNWLPLIGKVLYRMPENGLGVKFQEITQFEQDLLANLIQKQLEKRGLPYQNPYELPNVSKIGLENSTELIPTFGNLTSQEVLT